jgi:hypothetical protein
VAEIEAHAQFLQLDLRRWPELQWLAAEASGPPYIAAFSSNRCPHLILLAADLQSPRSLPNGRRFSIRRATNTFTIQR